MKITNLSFTMTKESQGRPELRYYFISGLSSKESEGNIQWRGPPEVGITKLVIRPPSHMIAPLQLTGQ